MATERGIGVAVITSTCGRGVGLGAQRGPLLDPEPVLLVDHHQPEVGELHAGAEQGVGADHDAGLARGGAGQWRRASDAADIDPVISTTPVRDRPAASSVPPSARSPSSRGDRLQVLGGQHLGGRQQRGLAAGVDDGQHGPQRHQRLARADLALQQPLHRLRPGQLGHQLVADLDLALRSG